MKTGDPKQARILAFVAALAVGFLVYRMIPSAGQEATNTLRQAEEQHAAAESGPLPDQITTDPFYHPRLLVATTQAESEPASAPSHDSQPSPSRLQPGPFVPWVGELPSLLPDPAASPSAPPNENPASGQESEQARRAEQALKVKAIIRSGKPRAVISIDGNQKTVHVGDAVGEGITVKRITDTEVVVSTPNGEKTLKVGKQERE